MNSKHILAAFVAVIMVFSSTLAFVSFSDESQDVDATVPSGYIPVTSAADLGRVGTGVDYGGYTWSLSASYYQTKDIVFVAPAAGQSNFTPIGISFDGSSVTYDVFTGIYDGNNFGIYNIEFYCSSSANWGNRAGLFATTGNASIVNTNIYDMTVVGETVDNAPRTFGAITAYALGSTIITNCHAERITVQANVSDIGGLAHIAVQGGYTLNAVFTDCSIDGLIIKDLHTAFSQTGGSWSGIASSFAGSTSYRNQISFSNCHVNDFEVHGGQVRGSTDTYISGIGTEGSFVDCSVKGLNVVSNGGSIDNLHISGMAYRTSYAIDSFVYGLTSTIGAAYFSGFATYANDVQNCYVVDIESTNGNRVSGFTYYARTVSNCFVDSFVNTNGSLVSGFCYDAANVSESYATNIDVNAQSRSSGTYSAFAYNIAGSVLNCYAANVHYTIPSSGTTQNAFNYKGSTGVSVSNSYGGNVEITKSGNTTTLTTRNNNSGPTYTNVYAFAKDVPQASYAGFDFDDVWAWGENYPNATLRSMSRDIVVSNELSSMELGIGGQFSYTPQTNVSDVSIEISGADWLTVSNGAIVGTATEIGAYDLNIKISKIGFNDTVLTATITVVEVGSAPSVALSVSDHGNKSYTISVQSAGYESLIWSIDDGTTVPANTVVVDRIFKSGVYSISVTATNQYGSNTDTIQIKALDNEPIEVATLNNRYTTAFQSVNVTSAPIIDGPAWLTVLDWGVDYVTVSGTPTSVNDVGKTFNVTVIAGETTTTWTLSVEGGAAWPHAGFSYSVDGLKVTITSTAINGDTVNYTYYDGATRTGATTYTYSASGTYVITQYVTANVGGTAVDTYSKTVTVTAPVEPDPDPDENKDTGTDTSLTEQLKEYAVPIILIIVGIVALLIGVYADPRMLIVAGIAFLGAFVGFFGGGF